MKTKCLQNIMIYLDLGFKYSIFLSMFTLALLNIMIFLFFKWGKGFAFNKVLQKTQRSAPRVFQLV